ncbi:ABC transporter [Roseateles sp. DAIF2]|uniref:ABC transporter n=1 Tax=Roseateles sp. DAIF2 TaxID=2714952 RepID=UPI0018A30171|nr:ABC transporter [Roseateles sp. DAIF2]QPF76237.1 ABC transporter [Roseateles sp. DAIF2]
MTMPAALLSLERLDCPGCSSGPLSFALRPGLSLVRGGEQRGKSSLLRLIAAAAAARGLGCFLADPLDPAQDPTPARAWLAALREQQAAGWRADIAAALGTAFALDEHLDKALFMLSAGSRRKLGLVAAAASGAAITLLDQPFAALDGRSARLLGELLAEAAEGRERAWVLADYELPAALAGVPLAATIELGD